MGCQVSRCLEICSIAIIRVDVGEPCLHDEMHSHDGEDGEVDEEQAVLGRPEAHVLNYNYYN